MEKFLSKYDDLKDGLLFHEEMYRFYIHHLQALGIILYEEKTKKSGGEEKRSTSWIEVELEVTNFGFTFIRACLPKDSRGYWTGMIDERAEEKGFDISGF